LSIAHLYRNCAESSGSLAIDAAQRLVEAAPGSFKIGVKRRLGTSCNPAPWPGSNLKISWVAPIEMSALINRRRLRVGVSTKRRECRNRRRLLALDQRLKLSEWNGTCTQRGDPLVVRKAGFTGSLLSGQSIAVAPTRSRSVLVPLPAGK
jgi:hypothetical protein